MRLIHTKQKYIFLIFCILFSSLVFAFDLNLTVGYDNLFAPRVIIDDDDNYASTDLNETITGNWSFTGDVTFTNLTGLDFINSSDYWDGLDTPADILGSLINNDLSWITQTVGNSLWCRLTGDTMTGNLNMSNNNLTNVKEVSVINSSYGMWSNSTDVVFGYIEGLG